MSIEVTRDAKVIVRAPNDMPESEIQQFIKDKFDWIVKNVRKMIEEKRKCEEQEKLSKEDIHKLGEQALAMIPPKVAYYAEKMGVTYGNITIRNQKSRWGSCSGKGNLNFNCLLMQTPVEVQDYVVVHELCHRKEMNHSKQFWIEVEKILPDYRTRKKWLKEHGSDICRR